MRSHTTKVFRNKMDLLETKEEIRFNCPFSGCVYANIGDKYFKKKMFLNHHIANVHLEKKYVCERCSKKYAMDWQLKYHMKSCGVLWSCVTCDKSYTERLSLVTHCKRHTHQLPANAIMKTTKTNAPQINVHLIVMPVIVDANASMCARTQQHRQILPKLSDYEFVGTDQFTQTPASEQCNNCKINAFNSVSSPPKSSEGERKRTRKAKCVSTQTDKYLQKALKARESRMCQTITKRNRKPACICESIETQTLESALHSNTPYHQSLKISASTSTTPPKKTRKRSSSTLTQNSDELSKKLCARSVQTIAKPCDIETSTQQFDEFFLNSANPLIGQISSITNAPILEQSVQTEAELKGESDISTELPFEFNDTHTQTVNLDINTTELLNFTDDDFLFSDLEFTDIETQTIWNNDSTTQTDDYFDEFDDVIKTLLENETNSGVSQQSICEHMHTQT